MAVLANKSFDPGIFLPLQPAGPIATLVDPPKWDFQRLSQATISKNEEESTPGNQDTARARKLAIDSRDRSFGARHLLKSVL